MFISKFLILLIIICLVNSHDLEYQELSFDVNLYYKNESLYTHSHDTILLEYEPKSRQLHKAGDFRTKLKLKVLPTMKISVGLGTDWPPTLFSNCSGKWSALSGFIYWRLMVDSSGRIYDFRRHGDVVFGKEEDPPRFIYIVPPKSREPLE